LEKQNQNQTTGKITSDGGIFRNRKIEIENWISYSQNFNIFHFCIFLKQVLLNQQADWVQSKQLTDGLMELEREDI